jgi:hypothetical protein
MVVPEKLPLAHYDGERQWYGAYMVCFSSICVPCRLIMKARVQVYIVFWHCHGYSCLSQRSALVSWPLNLPDRHTNGFLIDAQKGEVPG